MSILNVEISLETLPETKSSNLVTVNKSSFSEDLFENISSYSRLLNVVARILRILNPK